MILGILSLVLFCSCINIPMAAGAIIFGILQLVRSREGRGMAVAGIITAVLSVVALIVSVVLLWVPFLSYYEDGYGGDKPLPGYEDDYDYDFDYDDIFDYFDGRDRF